LLQILIRPWLAPKQRLCKHRCDADGSKDEGDLDEKIIKEN